MSASSNEERRLISLTTRYPDVSRATRYRIEHEKDFPQPVIMRYRKYYYEDEICAWEERRRTKLLGLDERRERRVTAKKLQARRKK